MNSKQIITGEKIQQLADIYIGNIDDLNYNTLIAKQINKHMNINNITKSYNNPKIIYCNTHCIIYLSKIIHFFENSFILISHNSDFNIYETEEIINILNSNKVEKWYSQNVCFYHPKLHMIPIGLANSMWLHGNLEIFDGIQKIEKTKKTFFNFSIHTNMTIRQNCYDKLNKNIEWLPKIEPIENLKRLSTYEFCICPEGNGADCHRTWEALYLKVIPIMIKSKFTETLQRNNIPIVLLDSWDDYLTIEDSLNYSDYYFGDYSFDKIKKEIQM